RHARQPVGDAAPGRGQRLHGGERRPRRAGHHPRAARGALPAVLGQPGERAPRGAGPAAGAPRRVDPGVPAGAGAVRGLAAVQPARRRRPLRLLQARRRPPRRRGGAGSRSLAGADPRVVRPGTGAYPPAEPVTKIVTAAPSFATVAVVGYGSDPSSIPRHVSESRAGRTWRMDCRRPAAFFALTPVQGVSVIARLRKRGFTLIELMIV